MSRASILVVDDEPRQLDILKALLEREGYEVATAASAESAQPLLARIEPELVLTDLKLPGSSGLELVEAVRRELPGCVAVVMTAHGSVESAVEAMKRGAFDYITKPIDVDPLLLLLDRALDSARLRSENRALREELQSRFALANLVGRHGSMQALFRQVRKIAPSPSTVLLLGESGTGKELIARAIHFNSPRCERPFVAVNCSAIPEPLLESELFGHERGAFTGAVQRKLGLFEQAKDGTLFLDEIGDLPLAMQAKLLRVIQERELRRVGGETLVAVPVRLVVATNRDLAQMMRDGEFREDLFYRLNVVSLAIPPLRERKTDIPELAEHFLDQLGRLHHTPPKRLLPSALELVMAYSWPGNVRQLEAAMERATVLADGDEIGAELLPAEVRGNLGSNGVASSHHWPLPEGGISLDALERSLLEQAIDQGRTLGKAAALLGISYRKLQYRLEKHGIRRGAATPNGADDEPYGVE